ncbi:MAG: class I SAM-dependent methyltransferase [Chitinophagales bacterium]
MRQPKPSFLSTLRKIKTKIFPYKDITDDYIIALSIANSGAGMLLKENLICFDYAIKNLPTNDPIVEIGSFAGLSANAIIYYLQKNNRNNEFFTCDKWDFEEKENSNRIFALHVSYEEYREFIKSSFIRNVEFFSREHLPFSLELFSDEFFDAWKNREELQDVFGRAARLGGPISFCYVDGNHKYEFVKRDFENVDEFLVPGGFIFFDDSADHFSFGSAKLMKEIKRRNDYEVVIKNPNYLFRKKF